MRGDDPQQRMFEMFRSKPFMQGVQTFFTTNHEGKRLIDSSAHLEAWGFYPDAEPIRSFYKGDPRAAIAPFQAFQCALLTTHGHLYFLAVA